MRNPLGFGIPRTSALEVWGEPTLVTLARPGQDLVHDGTVDGEVVTELGGSALATAVAAAATGCPVRLWVPLPEDAAGTAAAAELATHGIDVHPVPAPDLRRTSVLVDPTGTRSMVAGPSAGFTQPLAAAVPMPTGALLHVSASSLARDTTGAVRALLARSRAPISIDAGSPGAVRAAELDAACRALRPLLVFANADEADALGWAARPEYVGCYVVKRGGGTVTAEDETGTVHVAPPATPVIDTTGAGDAFAGGVLAGWWVGLELARALELGHAVAARAIDHLGTLVRHPVPRLACTETLW